jgi:hypothetical protein
MPLSNATPFQVEGDVPQLDHDGEEVLVVVIKATFERLDNGRLEPADEQTPVRLVDVPNGDADHASILLPSDTMPYKPSADVIVVGSAIPPRPMEAWDIGVIARDTVHPLRVHGPRTFGSRFGVMTIGPAAKFEQVPVVYEKAYGGISEDLSEAEPRNMSGVGVAKHPRELDGKPAPQIEHPARPHLTSRDRHQPMGFGPLPMHWSPRREYYGDLLDPAYRTTRMPNAPRDFDMRFYLQAHPTLCLDGYLAPGEALSVLGMAEHGTFQVVVPEHRIVVRARYDDRKSEHAPPIDTIVLLPNTQSFELLCRCTLPLGRTRGHLLRDVQVDTA